jgi:phosphoribosylaminoimidazole carboxylase (NCAIR synthetase)
VTVLVLNRRPLVERIGSWLADAGADLVLVTAASALRDGELDRCRHRFADVHVVPDYDGPDVARTALDAARRHRFTRVVSSTEVDLLRAARLRVHLGLPGQRPASALAFRDKHRMKSLAAAAGLPVAPMRRVVSARALHEFSRAVGFPLVVKPVDGGGSVGVRRLSGPADLARFTSGSTRFVPALLAEAWVDGDCWVVDGLMAGRAVVQSCAVRMGHSNLSVVTAGRHMTGWTPPVTDPVGRQVREFAAAVVAALPGPEETTAFHAEVFRRPDGELVLCEIAARPGGSGHAPAYEQGFGVNLHGATLRGQAGLAPAATPLVPEPVVRSGFCWLTPRDGVLLARPAHCPVPGVRYYRPTAEAGSRHHGARSVADHVAEVLVAADGDEDLGARLAEVEDWWAANAAWSLREASGTA